MYNPWCTILENSLFISSTISCARTFVYTVYVSGAAFTNPLANAWIAWLLAPTRAPLLAPTSAFSSCPAFPIIPAVGPQPEIHRVDPESGPALRIW